MKCSKQNNSLMLQHFLSARGAFQLYRSRCSSSAQRYVPSKGLETCKTWHAADCQSHLRAVCSRSALSQGQGTAADCQSHLRAVCSRSALSHGQGTWLCARKACRQCTAARRTLVRGWRKRGHRRGISCSTAMLKAASQAPKTTAKSCNTLPAAASTVTDLCVCHYVTLSLIRLPSMC